MANDGDAKRKFDQIQEQIKNEKAKKARLEKDIQEQKLRLAKKLQDRAPFNKKGAWRFQEDACSPTTAVFAGPKSVTK